MKERLLGYLRYANVGLYVLFFFACLALFASLTFPYRKLRDHVVASFNAQELASGGHQELQIDDLTGYWLSGARMRGVRLFSASSEPGQAPQKIEIDQIAVRYGLLSWLLGGSDVSFDARAFGGGASGSVETHGSDQSIEAHLQNIDIGRVEPLVHLLGVPLRGELGGSVKLTMPGGKISKATGSISIEAQNVTVGDGKAKIKGAIALPPIQVGTVTLAADSKDGTVKITKLNAGGKDLDLQGEGRIVLRDLTSESLCDAQVRFKINDVYRTKSDMTKTLFGAPGSNASPLFELADPRIKQSKRPDGFYAWAFRGPLARADFVPALSGASAIPQ
jgi:type II secretion system protein N